jgi:hypothetical protein
LKGKEEWKVLESEGKELGEGGYNLKGSECEVECE